MYRAHVQFLAFDGGSQPSLTPALGDPRPSSNLPGHQAHIVFRYEGQTHPHKTKYINLKKLEKKYCIHMYVSMVSKNLKSGFPVSLGKSGDFSMFFP